MRCNIIIAGKAGQGPNFLSEILSQALIKENFYVFYSRDYQSLIRGGHNFNMVSFSDKPIHSNSSKYEIIVCLDELSEKMHKKDLAKNATIIPFIKGRANMFYAGMLFKLLGIEFTQLEAGLKSLDKFDENEKDAIEGFEAEKRILKIEKPKGKIKKELTLLNGSKTTAIAAIASGLDIYYAYPMTPATPLMMELGTMQLNSNHKVVELENEIAVALAGIGSSVVGKRVMVGTSGGGFDLMTEGLSFAAIAEIPLVFYLAQRPGPGTGVATYTSQGDLNVALHSGHGEFSRFVLAPGDNEDSIHLTNESFYLTNKFKTPAIFLTDKHLGECKSLFDGKGALTSLKEIKSSIKPGQRFNSYERDEKQENIATEHSDVIKSNFEKRMKKQKEMEKEVKKFAMTKIYGNKNSKNLILSWGSTKGAILDAISENNIDAKFLQVLYMEPFPTKEVENALEKAKKVIVIENNATSPFSRLIAEKTGFIIEDKNKILRYDGRPFFSDELAKEIKRKLR